MIYLDNAATTGKKPQQVISAVEYALKNLSANPGRGGHKASATSGESVFGARKKVSDFFGAGGEDRVVFTPSCTYALNMAIKGALSPGDHVIMSSLEHNAVARPVYSLRNSGIIYDTAEVIFGDLQATVNTFERLIRPNTKMIVCTHSSNVTGEIMPLEGLSELCRRNGIIFVVDAAQTAGLVNIHLQKTNIDYLAVAPHKGLYAPMGTGILICKEPPKNTIIEGGTGVMSALPEQPEYLPERLEPGTINVPGIAGISAGIDFVRSKGIDNIIENELMLIERLYLELSKMRSVVLYTPFPKKGLYTPVLSFNIRNRPSTEVATLLDKAGICVRAGLHCSPSAHKRLGTIETGTVRVSTAYFNNQKEIEYLVRCVQKISVG